MAIFYATKSEGGKVVEGKRQTGSDGAVEGGKVRVRGDRVLGKSAVLQSGKCWRIHRIGGIRRITGRNPASAGEQAPRIRQFPPGGTTHCYATI